MNIFTDIEALQAFITEKREQAQTVGFVPTMGALHAGHISLVEIAKQQCSICIVSIFVNPTQFNDPKDLATYPRTLDADCLLLRGKGVDAVFAPSIDVIYPQETPVCNDYKIGRIAELMEGKYRPGHFSGVMQVVKRLFDITSPDKAFFGEKDFQQIAVIRAMCRLVDAPVEIVACPIVREVDGLALSSRNVRLSPEERAVAPTIYRVLRESLSYANKHSVQETKDWVTTQLNKAQYLSVEYFEVVDAQSLEPIERWEDSAMPHGCITVYCGSVRLIDNISYAP